MAFPVLPEPVAALVVSASESSLSLNWTYQSSGSRQRTGAQVVIEGGGIFTRLTVSSEDRSVTHSSLRPLTNYTLTVYVLSEVGRSQPTTVHTSTLSLSQLDFSHLNVLNHVQFTQEFLSLLYPYSIHSQLWKCFCSGR